MKNLVLAFIMMLSVVGIKAQYSTPGTGIVWNMDDLVINSEGAVIDYENGFLVTQDFTISLNDTIRLLSNETVKFSEATLITIMGTFQAEPPNQIVFTAVDTLMNYKGFRFEDTHESFLKNCVVEFGGGIDILNSDMLIENCVIQKNDKSNSTGAIDLFHSSPQIINCNIRLNKGPAVLSGATSECSPYIFGNILYRNNTENTNMPQINLGAYDGFNMIIIQENTVEGFYDQVGGIAITTLAGGNIICRIKDNTIINNRYGITAYGNDIFSEIFNNIIQDNNIQGEPMLGGSGINYGGGNTNVSNVSGNIISGNLWGITATGETLPNMGHINMFLESIGENYFSNNGNGGEIYALYNNTPNDLFAQNNFWGSMNPDSVEAVIFHQPDDASLGFVDYLPLLDTTTTSIAKTKNKEEFLVFPNPVETIIKFERPEIFKSSTKVKLTIVNSIGQIVFQKESQSNMETIDLSSFEKGMYIVRFTDGEITIDEKFIKY